MLQEKAWSKISFLILSLVGFCLVAIRCYYVPFSHDEVATFLFYIQPEKFIPFYAHPDANGHFLTNLSSWFCFKFFGSSPFVLRLPNLIGFCAMAAGVWKLTGLFRNQLAAFIFSSFFLLSWNFLAYFALCRGYALSMAFLIPAFYYFLQFFREENYAGLWKFLVFSQVALAANLTLVAVLGVLSGLLILHLILTKNIFRLKYLPVFGLQFGLLYFWVRYGLYLKAAGALYYGAGESYWQVTFVSLIETLFFKNTFLNYFILLLFVAATFFFAVYSFKKGLVWMRSSYFSLSYLVLVLLILGFFLLKVILGLNYPEDRTGLFFAIFFACSLCFLLDELPGYWSRIFLIFPLFFTIQFLSLCNFENHPWRVYETMPKRFYERLITEQRKSERLITIAGHRVREFFYGFLNYNSPVKLNHMTSPEALQMNCDYALAYRQDSLWFAPYYEELEKEEQWGFRLLKRKEDLQRRHLYQSLNYAPVQGKFLYSNLYEVRDTSFLANMPIQADVEFSISKTQVPLNLYIVMEIQSANPDEGNTFIRVPLNLIRYDWNSVQRHRISLVSGNLPVNIKRLVIYLWNIDESETEFRTHSFNLYQLHGKGVKEISKAPI